MRVPRAIFLPNDLPNDLPNNDVPMTCLLRRIPAALLLGLLCVWAGCESGAQTSPDHSPAAPPVEVSTSEMRTQPLPIHTSGRLASKAEIQLSFKIDGIIQQIRVDEGERVEKGDELARLDLSEINARVLEAESALQQARRNLRRTKRLYQDSVATQQELDDARTQVDVAEAKLQSARFNRKHAVITAPESGRILRRRAEAGEVVRAGQPVLVLGAVSRGWVVRVDVPARDVVRVEPGDSATVAFDAYPDRRFDARVTEMSDAAHPRTGTFELELSVPDPEQLLRSGFIGRVTLYPGGTDSHVTIPATALVEGSGQHGSVFTVQDSTHRVHRTRVRVARMLDSTVVLADGLRPGTRIVTAGTASLADGDSVRVTP